MLRSRFWRGAASAGAVETNRLGPQWWAWLPRVLGGVTSGWRAGSPRSGGQGHFGVVGVAPSRAGRGHLGEVGGVTSFGSVAFVRFKGGTPAAASADCCQELTVQLG